MMMISNIYIKQTRELYTQHFNIWIKRILNLRFNLVRNMSKKYQSILEYNRDRITTYNYIREMFLIKGIFCLDNLKFYNSNDFEKFSEGILDDIHRCTICNKLNHINDKSAIVFSLQTDSYICSHHSVEDIKMKKEKWFKERITFLRKQYYQHFEKEKTFRKYCNDFFKWHHNWVRILIIPHHNFVFSDSFNMVHN